MRAEYTIALGIVWFLVGYFIRDLKSLGADSPQTRRVPQSAPRKTRKPW